MHIVVVAEVIFTIIGFVLGQIRTLQRLSWLANLAIWLNVLVIIVTCVQISSLGATTANTVCAEWS